MKASPAGMLMSIVEIDPADTVDFNNWSDREHLPERVGIPGFVDARRFVSTVNANSYLSLYQTETFEILDSAAYRQALANQTAWSRTNLQRLLAVHRVIARISARQGAVWGGAALLARIPEPQNKPAARAAIEAELAEFAGRDGVSSALLMEADPVLSKPLGAAEPPPGSADWYVLIEGLRADGLDVLSGPFGAALRTAAGTMGKCETWRLISALPRL